MSGEYLDETHERIAQFAADFLEEDEREDFIGSLMERHGYQRQSHWAPPTADDGGGGKQPLVRPRSGGQQQRPRGQQQQQQQRRSYFKS